MPQNRTRPGRFAASQSGNPGGRPKNAEALSAQLREVLDETDKTDKTKARLIAQKLVARFN